MYDPQGWLTNLREVHSSIVTPPFFFSSILYSVFCHHGNTDTNYSHCSPPTPPLAARQIRLDLSWIQIEAHSSGSEDKTIWSVHLRAPSNCYCLLLLWTLCETCAPVWILSNLQGSPSRSAQSMVNCLALIISSYYFLRTLPSCCRCLALSGSLVTEAVRDVPCVKSRRRARRTNGIRRRYTASLACFHLRLHSTVHT